MDGFMYCNLIGRIRRINMFVPICPVHHIRNGFAKVILMETINLLYRPPSRKTCIMSQYGLQIPKI